MRIILLFMFLQLTTINFYGQNVNQIINSNLSVIEKMYIACGTNYTQNIEKEPNFSIFRKIEAHFIEIFTNPEPIPVRP